MPILAEWITLGMVCVAPWAFGSMDASAEFGLLLGSATVALLGVTGRESSPRGWIGRFGGAAGLGLLGLALLGLIQATPLPRALAHFLAPASATLRAGLLSDASEQIAGGPDVTGWLCIAQNPDNACRMATRLVGLWLLFVGVLRLRRGGAGMRRLAVALTINATILAVVALIQSLTWNGRLLWVRPIILGDAWSVGGPFDHHTHLAESLNMGLGLALGLAIPPRWRNRPSRPGGRTWACLAVVVIVVGIVASNSRGGFLTMIAAAIMTAMVARTSVLRLGVGGMGLVTLIAAVLAVLGSTTPILRRLQSIGDLTNAGYAVRLNIWRAALRAWWSSPLWGTGFGSFRTATAPFLNSQQGATFARAENEYLDLLTEGGLLGWGLFLVVAIGVIRQARVALKQPAQVQDRHLLLGTIFGVLTLAINSLSDYGPHVAGVMVPAVVLIGVLCRAGNRGEETQARSIKLIASHDRLIAVATGVVAVGVAGASTLDIFADVRAEAFLTAAALPGLDDPAAPENGLAQERPGLERQRVALERALSWRPGWADGHLRLGMIELALANHTAKASRADQSVAMIRSIPDPVALVALARHFSGIEGSPSAHNEPARRLLEQAARNFAAARWACPVMPTPHIELACLQDLHRGGNSATHDLTRAFQLAGVRPDPLMNTARAAVALGERDLAARCWRRCLESDPGRFDAVAEAATPFFDPDQILTQIVPDGTTSLLFAERLAGKPTAAQTRRTALELALNRLPGDPLIEPAERLHLVARAATALDRRDQAREQMEAALALRPENIAWRQELVGWLLTWGQFDEAHEQAKIAFYYAPANLSVRQALTKTIDALARRGVAQ